MNHGEQKHEKGIIFERALLISPTSELSDIPESHASQGVTIEALRALKTPNLKQRLQKALGSLSLK